MSPSYPEVPRTKYRPGDRVLFRDEPRWRAGVVERLDLWPLLGGGKTVTVIVRPLIGKKLSESRYTFRLDSPDLRLGEVP